MIKELLHDPIFLAALARCTLPTSASRKTSTSAERELESSR